MTNQGTGSAANPPDAMPIPNLDDSAPAKSAYELQDREEKSVRRTLAIIVDNEPGILARIVGLFTGRGYNIHSLTVSTVNENHTLSRITLVTIGKSDVVRQICTQVDRLIPVRAVQDLTLEGTVVEKELALVKVVASEHQRRESLRIADIFNARVADTTLKSFVFLVEGSPGKLDAFIELMRALGACEVARSGVVAIPRGTGIGSAASDLPSGKAQPSGFT